MKGIGFFEDQFKSLINLICAYDASDRIGVEEIRVHPWVVEGEIATHEEVLEEF